MRKILLTALLTFLSSFANAGDSEFAPFGIDLLSFERNWNLSLFQQRDLLVADPVLTAKGIHDYCTSILAFVPRLSPAEKEWLAGEQRAGRDLENIYQRREFALEVIYRYFDDCVKQARLAAVSSTERERVIGWTRLSQNLVGMQKEFLVAHTSRAGSVNLKSAVERYVDLIELHKGSIIDSIVLPYLLRSK